MDRSAPKLAPQLIPEPLWRLSAYRVLPRKVWDRLRAGVLAAAANRCTVCGEAREKGMVCHEVWAYDDGAAIAMLTGFEILCPDCDGVHHLGLAGLHGRGDKSIAHMANVNDMTREEALRLLARSFEQWAQRSRHPWKLSVSPPLLERYSELTALESQEGRPGEGRARVRNRRD